VATIAGVDAGLVTRAPSFRHRGPVAAIT
jgi:hypothetical protein